MSELEDFAIIEAIRNGSEKILFKIYSEYRDEFIGWAISNNKLEIDEAKDIFQETIISFHQNLKSGKQEHQQASVKTYLFAIGKNKIKDHFRAIEISKRHEENIFTIYKNSPIDENELEIIENIKRIIRSMNEKCRQILTLFYIRSFDMESIAIELGFKNSDVAKKSKYECMKSLEEKVKTSLKATNGRKS